MLTIFSFDRTSGENRELNKAELDMKNSADQGGCYSPKPKAQVDNILWDL